MSYYFQAFPVRALPGIVLFTTLPALLATAAPSALFFAARLEIALPIALTSAERAVARTPII